MESQSAVDAVRAKLEATFGKAMAMMIMASASNVAGVPTAGITNQEFLLLADAVCRDQRVIDMWGSAAAADTAVEWKRLV